MVSCSVTGRVPGGPASGAQACYICAMTVTLTPEQMRWLEQAVAEGRFSSVEEAVRVAVDRFIIDQEFGDLSWAKPYLDEARAEIARGEGIELDSFLARLRSISASS